MIDQAKIVDDELSYLEADEPQLLHCKHLGLNRAFVELYTRQDTSDGSSNEGIIAKGQASHLPVHI